MSYITGVPGSTARTGEMIQNSVFPTSLISGFDLKMIFPSRRENIQWLLGSFYQDGEDSNTNALVSAIYFGPQLSTKFRYVNFSAYISAGIFNVSDEITVKSYDETIFNSVSNYTSVGTKSGLNLSFCYKSLTLAVGYQIFMTSSKNAAFAYHGIELGLGVKF